MSKGRGWLSIYSRLFRYARSHRLALGAGVVLAILVGLAELARPWPLKIIVDYGLNGLPMPSGLQQFYSALPGGDSQGGIIIWSVVGLVLVVSAAAALTVLGFAIVLRAAKAMVVQLAHDVFEKLQRLSLTYHGRHQVGDLLQRVGADTFVAQMGLNQVAIPAVLAIVSLGGMFFVMARLDLAMSLIALSVVPALGVAFALFRRPLDETTARQWKQQGSLMALLEQSLGSIRVIQAFARETYMQRKLADRTNRLGAAFYGATLVSAGYGQAVAFITGLAAAVMMGVGAFRVIDGRLSVGDLLIFLGYLAALYVPITALSTSIGAAVQVVARGRRVFEVLDSEEEIPEADDAVELERAVGEITFEGVTFGYTGDEDERNVVLHDVSFTAEPGVVTAIVGATGSGKTSLISLLPRFYDPWGGRVLLDGVDLRNISLRSLRENISLVLQDAFLFPMSIAENIAFGNPDATDRDVERAARAAQAHNFITALPEGYDTVIGEKGATLSGGERQRIAIARAIIKDSPILILDEPTSSLDAHTEEKIFEAISHLIKDRTTFIISHRLTTIRRADQILAIDRGRIVERGTHESLMTAGNLYSRLYRRQHIAAI